MRRTIIPRPKPDTEPANSECITRQMTPEERKRYGLPQQPIGSTRRNDYRMKPEHKKRGSHRSREKYGHLTKEFLQNELRTKSRGQIALEQGIPKGSLSTLMIRYDLSSRKQVGEV